MGKIQGKVNMRYSSLLRKFINLQPFSMKKIEDTNDTWLIAIATDAKLFLIPNVNFDNLSFRGRGKGDVLGPLNIHRS